MDPSPCGSARALCLKQHFSIVCLIQIEIYRSSAGATFRGGLFVPILASPNPSLNKVWSLSKDFPCSTFVVFLFFFLQAAWLVAVGLSASEMFSLDFFSNILPIK